MQPLPHESVEIDGVRFTTTKFPATRGFSLLTRLTKTIGGALLVLSKLDESTELDPKVVIDALSTLDPVEADALLPLILAGTTAVVKDDKGTRQVVLDRTTSIDSAFSHCEFMTMFRVLGHAIRTNFGNFGLGSAASAAAPQATSGG